MARTLVGTSLDLLSPRLASEIESGAISGRNVRLKKWILHARLENARRRGDTAAVEKLLHLFWRGDTSTEFYNRYTDRFDLWFLGPHHEIVDVLEKQASGHAYRQLIEIGCGDGRVLAYLAQRLLTVGRFVGVDINSAIIKLNSDLYAREGKLSFLAGNASNLLETMIEDGTILMTYGGVMEYFSEAELLRIFARLARQNRTAMALVEPVDPAHDLLNDMQSHIFGGENSFSHNHKYLLETSGFRAIYSREMNFGGVRWMLIFASKE